MLHYTRSWVRLSNTNLFFLLLFTYFSWLQLSVFQLNIWLAGLFLLTSVMWVLAIITQMVLPTWKKLKSAHWSWRLFSCRRCLLYNHAVVCCWCIQQHHGPRFCKLWLFLHNKATTQSLTCYWHSMFFSHCGLFALSWWMVPCGWCHIKMATAFVILGFFSSESSTILVVTQMNWSS